MPQKVTSVGFIIQCKDGKYLLGKADKHPEPHCWTVFKGGQEVGESMIDTAIRELKEETGIDLIADDRLNKNISTNIIYTYSLNHKDVFLYLLTDVEGVLDDFQFNCSSFWGEDKRPEIAGYKKFTLEEMEKNIFPSQRGLVEVLKKIGNKKVK